MDEIQDQLDKITAILKDRALVAFPLAPGVFDKDAYAWQADGRLISISRIEVLQNMAPEQIEDLISGKFEHD